MWKFLLFTAAVIIWPALAQDQQVYLTTHANWNFYKILVTGQMTNANVKATCEAAGMRYPCYYSGTNGCHTNHWTSDCIAYDNAAYSCYTPILLATKLCGTTVLGYCQPLDDTFVYLPWNGQVDGGARGVDYETHTYNLHGANYYNKYALCADVVTCARSPCVHGNCTDDVMGYTCTCENGWGGTNCDQYQQVYLTTHDSWNFYKILVTGWMTNANVKATCEAAGMRYPCWTSGADGCSDNWRDSDCIAYDSVGTSCKTHWLLSSKLCGISIPQYCQPLDDTFVYCLGRYGDDSASGVDYDSHSYALKGADYSNMYAICADVATCEVSPCVHGTCIDDVMGYTCTCESGWGGTNCDRYVATCEVSPCVHGTCIDDVMGYTCTCENGWGGTNCDQNQQVYLGMHDNWAFYKILVIGQMTNANVQAACEVAGMRYPCFGTVTYGCTSGRWPGCITYSPVGTECRTHYILASKLCGRPYPQHCQPLDDSFMCIYGMIYDGTYGVDYDTHTYGLNGADHFNKYALCAVATCARSPCVHGTCTDDAVGYTCTCENGWGGTNCDQNVDECASSPCTHGTCTDGVGSYTCSCENGWTGLNCDQDIDECASNPCLLGGTCLDHVDGYSCVCPKDATGKNCDTVPFIGDCYQFSTSAVNHRDATQACSTNDGRMVDLKDVQQQQFLASTIAATTGVSNWLAMKTAPLPILYSDGTPVRAPLQWSADEPSSPLDMCVLLDSSDSYKATTAFCTEQHNYVCQDELKPCEPNVCQNGGNCTSCFGGSTTFCDCLEGFGGKLCEINTDECVSNPCQHGGSCLDQVNSYRCRCPTGYSGDNCETEIDWCAMVTCPFDWTCQNLITHFSCLAPIVRMLEPYKCSSASCPGDMYCREDSDASFSCWVN